MNIGTVRKEKDLSPYFYNDKCDIFDYLTSVGCGAIAGVVDIFLVGMPGNSALQGLTDAQADKLVMEFAKKCGWSPKPEKANSVASAISFLEQGTVTSAKAGFSGFKVNYDQRHSGDVDKLFRMSTQNHHMKSLSHAPDLVGLFFSLLNQFTSTSSFLHNGQLITITTDTFELKGHNLVSKLFCGIANWFGHIMSDVAGSSGAVDRGSGIVIPFFELFQLFDIGRLQVGKNRNTIATIATKVFEAGYDARFGATMAIPVVICDLSIKLIWALKHYFYHKRPIEECIPSKRHDDLRIMLIIGDGTLCVIDGVDAAAKSGGDWVVFFLRLNLIAWYRFVSLVLREVCIRLGISFPLQKQLDAYIRVNAAIALYLSELEKIDIELFRKETELCKEMAGLIANANNEDEINHAIKEVFAQQNVALPWQGEFSNFMQDKSERLVFG